MTEDGAAVSKQHHHGVSKFLNKDKWRSKMSSISSGSSFERIAKEKEKERESAQNVNADVEDFLRSSKNKSPKAPRIGLDIAAAQRVQTTASNVSGNASGNVSSNGLATPSILRKSDYPRRALNLTVSFTNAIPDIIGEGGDESEVPVIEISRQRRALAQQGQNTVGFQPSEPGIDNQPAGNYSENPNFKPGGQSRDLDNPALQYQDLIGSNSQARHNSFPDEEPDFVPKPIKRSLTRFSDLDDGDVGTFTQSALSQEPQSAGPSSTPSSAIFGRSAQQNFMDDSPAEVTNRLGNFHFTNRQSSLNSPVLQDKIHKMRAEEGKALHEAAAQNPFEDTPEDSSRFSTSTTSSFKPASPEEPPVTQFSSPRGQGLVHPQPSMFGSMSTQTSGSQMPTPSPSNYPVPDLQSRAGSLMRKPIPSPQVMTQLAPTPREPPQGIQPRPSPSLNVTIPNKDDYFSPPGRPVEQPSKPNYASYRAQESFSATSSVTPKTPYTPYTASSTSSVKPQVAANPSAALAQLALEDFVDRCSHMGGIFRLQAEFERPINDFTPMQWLRTCAWWFLRGRAGIEGIVRNLPRGEDGRPESRHGEQLLCQPHVDLAKCWWILNDVINKHPALRPSHATDFGQRAAEGRNAGDSATVELFENAEILMTNLRAVLSSMRRNNVMPPTHALIQGQDQSIWVRYPSLAPNLLPILSGNMSRSLTDSGNIQKFNALSVIAVADTRLDFSYNRMFVKASLGSSDESVEQISLHCLVSVMRERNDWHPKVTICTQKELVTLCIQGDRKRGPSWSDVKWNEQAASLLVQLPHGYTLTVQLSESDFRQLFNLYNHTFRVQTSLLPRSNEQIVYEVSLRDFQYNDSRNPPAFPPERVKRCRIRVFATTETVIEGTGQRKFYRGFRLLAVTSPKNRILGSASHDLGVRYPVILGTASDPSNEDAPAMTLEVQEDRRKCNMLMVFNDPKDCEGLWNTLSSLQVSPEEMEFANIPLRGLAIEQTEQMEAYSPASRNPLGRMQWHNLVIINRDPQNPDHEVGQTVLSESLRIVAKATGGAVTDRINLGPGEMRIRLQTDGYSELAICRPPQDDLSICLDPSNANPYLPEEIRDVQRTVFQQSTLRTYSFYTLEDLHRFETSITGYTVRYDGLASAFAVARRRPVAALSKHKKIEATTTRLQVVSHEHHRVVQLLAFFDDLPQADALNLQLKGMDVFERYDSKHGKGKYGVKLVDAKFSLPKVDKEERAATPDGKGRVERKFVSLDMLDPPAENDDIIIGFEEEREREKFLAALPAPAQVSRGLTLKRRI